MVLVINLCSVLCHNIPPIGEERGDRGEGGEGRGIEGREEKGGG